MEHRNHANQLHQQVYLRHAIDEKDMMVKQQLIISINLT